jgi:hypothetical protein
MIERSCLSASLISITFHQIYVEIGIRDYNKNYRASSVFIVPVESTPTSLEAKSIFFSISQNVLS